jgi:3'(2'), 5'-bisphosphate nucleotidase
MTTTPELDELVRVAVAASSIIRRHYATKFAVDYKIGDDPVTAADREANEFICAELTRAFPGVPIVAEESDPSTFDVRRDADACFFVDPLDGTREFVARNGEFAVMIGLARRGRAALGVVVAPETNRIFAGGPSVPSFEIVGGARRPISPRRDADAKSARAVVSRSHTTPGTLEALARMGVTHIEKLGSAGLKAAAVACGEADLWIQNGPAGKLWDACGPEAIVLGARGHYGVRGAPPSYADGPLDLDAVVVAANEALFDAARDAMQLS